LKQRIKDSYNKLRATNILSNFFNLSGIQLSNILVLFLTIPIVTRQIGLKEYGTIMVANRLSLLIGSLINYGTGQSGVRDTAFNLKDPKILSGIIYNTLYVRVIIFALFLVALPALKWTYLRDYYPYILLALPIAFAEVVNPLCFFIGAERLKVFNFYNMVFNIVSVAALIIFIKGPQHSGWVNFILGMGNVVTYLVLLFHFRLKFKLPFHLPSRAEILKIGRDNFYLTVNNISVNLQQSIIIFALPRWGFSILLGPYALCDRVIGQCRNLLITLSNALYPHAAHIYQQNTNLWNVYRRKTKYIIVGLSFTGSIAIFFMADFIVYTLSKEHNATAILFLKIMAFVPTMSALNVLNVLDQLLKNNAVYIFRIAIALFAIAVVTALILLNIGNSLLIGSFTLIVETCAWLMYEFVIKKKRPQNA
jgi:O-antigen/teichoic acid export membrane protein